MRRDTEAFLDLVRDAEDPTRADEARVQRALRAAIAAGVAPSVEPRVEMNGGVEGTAFGDVLAKLGLSGAKLHLVAVCAAATLATGDTGMPPGSTDAGGALPASATSGVAPPLDPGAIEPAAPLDPAPTAAPLDPDISVPRFSPARAAPNAPASPPSAFTAPPAPVRAKPRVRAAEAAEPVAASGLRGELELLQRVQAALKRGDAAAALRELEAHRTTDGTLLAERRAARILALCQLGRVDDARRAAAVFVERHPDSLQRAAVDGSCANR
jgi:hypothetical protein